MLVSDWKLLRQDEAALQQLQESLSTDELTARLLINRGLTEIPRAQSFLACNEDCCADPFALRDMDKAVARLQKAVENKERVAVYGDYDVDGITSVALLVHYLRSVGIEADYYIPDRMGEGYGINISALESISQRGFSLVVTVDTGITASEEIRAAARLGLDVIVTDHHRCGETLPPAIAVIDPMRADCPYPFKGLAGVGVAFKLVCALHGDCKAMLERYADLVTLGTVADIMPLTDENRYMVRLGLEKLNRGDNQGVNALLTAAGSDGKKITSQTIGYTLAPRLNAAGRMAHASLAVELFLSPDRRTAAEAAESLCAENRLRQETEKAIFEDAVRLLEQREGFPGAYHSIVLAGDNWHHGVVGIVASRLCEKYGLPAILISFDGGGTGKGSCRSVGGLNLFELLGQCRHLLERFGGHHSAAGLSLRKENVETFALLFDELCAQKASLLSPEEMVLPTAECTLSLPELTVSAVETVDRLEPFGGGNPAPLFEVSHVRLTSAVSIGNDRHTRAELKSRERSVTALFFGTPLKQMPLPEGAWVDALCSLQLNEYNGACNVQLIVRGLRPSQVEQTALQLLKLPCGDLPCLDARCLPEREDFRKIYLFAYRFGPLHRFSLSALAERAFGSCAAEDLLKTTVCLRVLADEGLIDLQTEDPTSTISLSISSHVGEEKVDLQSNPFLKQLTQLSKGGGTNA
ncbi:MAG: single-stranded-DNA-specific exonuclease RecJ [Clostridia bacterium]|nr:single-stranded-DNA-specific exonuclease RecJ [Clostridia bacterium]